MIFLTFINLFSRIFLINLFTFGGGYTIIPIIDQTFVEELKLIKKDEMKDIIALASSVPGALAVSTSFLVGYKIKGKLGAIISALASVTPCIIVIMIIFNIYNLLINNPYVKSVMRGIGVTISAVLLATVIKMLVNLFKSKRKYIFITIFILAFILTYFFNVHIIIVLILSSILGRVVKI